MNINGAIENQSAKKTKIATRDVILSGLFIAMVFVATKLINIPTNPHGGLVHIGTGMLYIIAIMFGKNHGAIAGGVGMALFDVFSPWIAWTPGTFVVRSVMGYMVGYIANDNGRKGKNTIWNVVAMIAGGVWMIIGYYLYNSFMFRSFILAVGGIQGDITQIVAGLPIALFVITALKKVKYFDQFIK